MCVCVFLNEQEGTEPGSDQECRRQESSRQDDKILFMVL